MERKKSYPLIGSLGLMLIPIMLLNGMFLGDFKKEIKAKEIPSAVISAEAPFNNCDEKLKNIQHNIQKYRELKCESSQNPAPPAPQASPKSPK